MLETGRNPLGRRCKRGGRRINANRSARCMPAGRGTTRKEAKAMEEEELEQPFHPVLLQAAPSCSETKQKRGKRGKNPWSMG